MGGLDHATWRQQGIPSCKEMEYFIDGDLVEMFLEVNEEGKQRIVEEVNAMLKRFDTVKWMTDYIQRIKSLHSSLC